MLADFFNYKSPYRVENYTELEMYKLSTLEYILPILFVFVSAVLLIYFRNYFKNVRLYAGVVFVVIYLSHYVFRFALYGFDTIVLPFQLCSISMFLAIILIITKSRTIHSFVLYTGVLGGLISLFIPVYLNDSSYYRYYQYVLAHSLLILTPIYFMAVHDYIPSKKETIYGFLILQTIATFMVIFNYFMGTDFMFVFINADKIEKFPVIENFGGIPLYLLWVEIVGITIYTIAYNLIRVVIKINKKYKIL